MKISNRFLEKKILRSMKQNYTSDDFKVNNTRELTIFFSWISYTCLGIKLVGFLSGNIFFNRGEKGAYSKMKYYPFKEICNKLFSHFINIIILTLNEHQSHFTHFFSSKYFIVKAFKKMTISMIFEGI